MNLEKSNQFVTLLYRGRKIARRYLVTNGFDGALTMLGLMTGFYLGGATDLKVAVKACLGAAIALFVSGFFSAYLSETAERKKELREMEQALLVDLKESDYGEMSRWLPLYIALVNGLSPLLISLLILTPLLLACYGMQLAVSPFLAAVGIAFISIFFLGVYLGKISRSFWLWAGVRAVLIAVIMITIIMLLDMGG